VAGLVNHDPQAVQILWVRNPRGTLQLLYLSRLAGQSAF